MRVEHIYISPDHNFFGHHGIPPGQNPMITVDQAECVAKKGILGDRFFDYKKDYKGQITFFSREVYEDLCLKLNVTDKSPSAFRRNVIVSETDLNAWIGRRFSLQGIEFEGREECRPCAWMDQSFAPGAEALLKGRGGLRAAILTNGILQSGSSSSSSI